MLRLVSVLYTDFSLSFDPPCLYSWNTLTTQSGLPPMWAFIPRTFQATALLALGFLVTFTICGLHVKSSVSIVDDWILSVSVLLQGQRMSLRVKTHAILY